MKISRNRYSNSLKLVHQSCCRLALLWLKIGKKGSLLGGLGQKLISSCHGMSGRGHQRRWEDDYHENCRQQNYMSNRYFGLHPDPESIDCRVSLAEEILSQKMRALAPHNYFLFQNRHDWEMHKNGFWEQKQMAQRPKHFPRHVYM